jgi:hypothetical protein
MSEDDLRFQSIEKQLNRINEKFDTVIRLEEKHNSLNDRMLKFGATLHKHANLIMELQHKCAISTKAVGGMERFVWMIVAAGLGLVASFSHVFYE